MDAVKNQEGVDVLPLAAYNPVEPRQGVIFDDDLYKELSGTQGESSPPNPAPTGAPPAAVQDNVPQGVQDNVQMPTAHEGTTPTEPQAPPVAPVEEVTMVDIDSIIKQKSGGKFERLEDLLQVSDKPTTADVQFANEQSKLVYDYLKEGKIEEVTNFLTQKQYLSNVEKLSPNELLQLKIQMTMTDLTPEEQQDEYNDALEAVGLNIDRDEYLTEDDYEKAVKKGLRKLKSQLNPFIDDVKAFRQELSLPELNKPTNEVPLQKSLLDSFVQSLSQESVADKLRTVDEIKLSSVIDKDVRLDYNYTPDDAQKSELQQAMKSYEADFKSRYAKDGGTFDYEAIQRDIFIRNNFEKIVAAAAKDAYMKGKLGQAMTLANATNGSPAPGTGVPADVATQSYHESLAKFLAAT